MNRPGYKLGARWRLIVGAMALVALAEAGSAEEKAPIEVVEAKPPGACKNLGKVTGMTQGNPVIESGAKRDALLQARDLGATHFWYMSEYSGQKGTRTWVYFGIAYRCQAPPATAPSPAK
jgi:hypothetical protein